VDCKAAGNLVSVWLDGRLSSGEADFMRHLDGCRACARKTEELQAVLAALRETGAAYPAPDGFAGRVVVRLQAEPLSSGSHMLFRRLALAASFVFLLGMNSLLVGRYLGGNNQVAAPPVTDPAIVTEPAQPGPSPADRAEQPAAPAQSGQEVLPGKQEPLVPAGNPGGTADRPRQAGPKQAAKAQRMPSPPPVASLQQPDAAKQPEQQLRVASLSPAIIPDPEVFVQKRRVTEGVLLKVAVTELPQVSQRLAEAAGMHGLAPTMSSEALSDDGRLIRVYRYEVPYLQANRFVAEALRLGRVLDERYVTEDVSEEYGRKLDQYRQLSAKAQEVGSAEAEELHRRTNALLLDLAGMHSTSREMKAVTIWLES